MISKSLAALCTNHVQNDTTERYSLIVQCRILPRLLSKVCREDPLCFSDVDDLGNDIGRELGMPLQREDLGLGDAARLRRKHHPVNWAYWRTSETAEPVWQARDVILVYLMDVL